MKHAFYFCASISWLAGAGFYGALFGVQGAAPYCAGSAIVWLILRVARML